MHSVGNSRHLLFDDEFDFALDLPKSTHSALTKQSDFEDLPPQHLRMFIPEGLTSTICRAAPTSLFCGPKVVSGQSEFASSHFSSALFQLRVCIRQLPRLC